MEIIGDLYSKFIPQEKIFICFVDHLEVFQPSLFTTIRRIHFKISFSQQCFLDLRGSMSSKQKFPGGSVCGFKRYKALIQCLLPYIKYISDEDHSLLQESYVILSNCWVLGCIFFLHAAINLDLRNKSGYPSIEI